MSDYTVRMTELLKTKKKHLLEILKITNYQTEAIQEGNDDRLDELINGKQLIIDKVNLIDNEFTEVYNKFKSDFNINTLDELSGQAKESMIPVKAELAEVNEALREIFEKEKQNSQHIQEEFTRVKNKLKEINAGKKFSATYEAKQYNADGAFIDKKK